ncbi:hypothetical protein F441_03321 [Phytophthora nicotianae CJ01A1]|uniref:Uncharacterized protein n=1 Tax=Phytophthora nicotianae CJ01A1 TaxID=1317063 RepID=W2XLN0_PHYNI|nr:hypothetical protein F441_03321 [Phytophthora nicotianae CJ01A1]
MPADVLHELKSDAEYADENERERDLQRAVGPITRSRAKKIALSENMRAMGGTTCVTHTPSCGRCSTETGARGVEVRVTK